MTQSSALVFLPDAYPELPREPLVFQRQDFHARARAVGAAAAAAADAKDWAVDKEIAALITSKAPFPASTPAPAPTTFSTRDFLDLEPLRCPCCT